MYALIATPEKPVKRTTASDGNIRTVAEAHASKPCGAARQSIVLQKKMMHTNNR